MQLQFLSYQVNTTSRQRIRQQVISYGSGFLFSILVARGHVQSNQLGKFPAPRPLIMTALVNT